MKEKEKGERKKERQGEKRKVIEKNRAKKET